MASNSVRFRRGSDLNPKLSRDKCLHLQVAHPTLDHTVVVEGATSCAEISPHIHPSVLPCRLSGAEVPLWLLIQGRRYLLDTAPAVQIPSVHAACIVSFEVLEQQLQFYAVAMA